MRYNEKVFIWNTIIVFGLNIVDTYEILIPFFEWVEKLRKCDVACFRLLCTKNENDFSFYSNNLPGI